MGHLGCCVKFMDSTEKLPISLCHPVTISLLTCYLFTLSLQGSKERRETLEVTLLKIRTELRHN